MIAGVLFLAMFCASHDSCKQRLAKGVSKFSMSCGDIKLELLVDTTVHSKDPEDLVWGAFDSNEYRGLLQMLKLRDGGRRVSMPSTAYSGLSWISSVEINHEDSVLAIKIRGGDAAGSYRANMKFLRKAGEFNLVQKEIRCSEFPDEVFEITNYSWINLETWGDSR